MKVDAKRISRVLLLRGSRDTAGLTQRDTQIYIIPGRAAGVAGVNVMEGVTDLAESQTDEPGKALFNLLLQTV